MASGHCLSSSPASTHTVRLSWILGCILSCVGYGILLAVGHACLLGLRRSDRETGGHSKLKKMLAIYVLFTLVLTTVTQVIDIIITVNSVLDDECYFQGLQPHNPYLGLFAIPIWLIDITTDGLFIWRCYAICRGLPGQRKWYILLWVLPLIVYFAMLCVGFTAVIRFGTAKPGEPLVFDVLFPLVYGITGFLNVLITVCIIILILRYRSFTASVGRNRPYLNLMMVLVESASLVVIVDGFVVGGYIQGVWGNVAGQVWIPMQPLASFLIIYRVSRGSDYFRRQQSPVSSQC